MEFVGLLASVGTLIEGANYIRTTLKDYRKGGQNRDLLLAEVDNLASVLSRLKIEDYKAKENGKEEAWLDSVGQLSAPGGVLERIDDVIKEIKPKVQRKPGIRGALVQWTWPFLQEDVDRNVRQMQRLSHIVSLVLDEASLKLTLAIHERLTRVDLVTNKRELRLILEWLSPLNFLEQQRLEFLKVCPGTCEWFLSSPEYTGWRNKEQRVLYCSAIGGAGKTILASAAADDLRMQTAGQDAGIFILYCKHDRPETHSAEKLAMTMLRQLVQIKAGRISSDLEELLEKHYYTHDTKPDFEAILTVLNAQLPSFSATFVILDGLDEIMQEAAREEVISFLMRLSGEPRIMFTSRPIDAIEKVFLRIGSHLEIDDIGLLRNEDRGACYGSECGSEDSYDYDWGPESGSEATSDQTLFETTDNDQVRRTDLNSSGLGLAALESDEASPQQPDNFVPCSKCGQAVTLLQYHCQKCTISRSIICVTCHDSGGRCVTGDSGHDLSVTLTIPCMKMDVSARPRAIRTYVRYRTQQSLVLKKFVKHKEGFAREIEDVVTRAAQKMFLLAQLHMDAMSDPDLLRFSEVRHALENLPTRLYDSYDKAMERTQGHGKSLLRLIAYAQRPLNTQEVEHALGVSSGVDEILEDEIIPASTLISRCAGLVTLDQNYEVVFSHYTIAGYFAKRRDDLFGNGHEYMTETCLTYLKLKEFYGGPVRGEEEGAQFDIRSKAYPFFEYASVFWAVHARVSQDDQILELSYNFIKDDEHRNACIQALWYSSDETTATWRSRSGGSPLHLAMYFKYQKLANRLLRDGIDANIQDPFGMTPLMWAARAGDMEMTAMILQMQVPLNALNNDGENAFRLAILHNQEGVAVLLIDQKDTDVNALASGERGIQGVTPLMLAVERRELKVVRKLLTRGDTLVNAQDTRGSTALHRAVFSRNLKIVKALVALPSIDLEPPDKLGLPPLTAAAQGGNASIVRVILDAGADINILQNEQGSRGNALMRAADYDRVSVVHELIERGIDWNAKDTFNRSALHSAAINGSANTLAVLLDLPGIDVDLQDINGNTPMHDAAGLSRESDALTLLLNKGARADIRNNRGKTPLEIARKKGIRRNASILAQKYTEDFGMPLRSLSGLTMEEPTLTEAAEQGDVAAIESILAACEDDKTIDIEERDDWLGRTPLQHATDRGSLSIVKKLHQAGAKINAQDRLGRSALHIAALRNRFKLAHYLLRNGADVTLKDHWGVNVMEDAIPSLQVTLIQYGIKITRDHDLERLLFFAAVAGNMKAVTRLVKAGAKVQVKDGDGYSPYELAKREGKFEVAKYLDQIGKTDSTAAKSQSSLATPATSSDSIKTLDFSTTMADDSLGVKEHEQPEGLHIKYRVGETEKSVAHQMLNAPNAFTSNHHASKKVFRTDDLATWLGVDIIWTWIYVIISLPFLLLFTFGLYRIIPR